MFFVVSGTITVWVCFLERGGTFFIVLNGFYEATAFLLSTSVEGVDVEQGFWVCVVGK